jgi:hypothetical protein
MPDQTVKVSFTAPNTFAFDPPTATVTAAGKVNFHRSPGSSTWTFVSINGLPSSQFTSSLTGNGSEIAVNDAHSSTGDFGYTVTVHDATGNHTSQAMNIKETTPPMIRNL